MNANQTADTRRRVSATYTHSSGSRTVVEVPASESDITAWGSLGWDIQPISEETKEIQR